MYRKIKPWLFANHSREDKEAIRLLHETRVPFENMGPSWETPTPFLEYGPWKFVGIEGIKHFIDIWTDDNLPPIKI